MLASVTRIGVARKLDSDATVAFIEHPTSSREATVIHGFDATEESMDVAQIKALLAEAIAKFQQ